MNEQPIFIPYGFDKAKLVSQMQENGLNGILLTSPENVYYTTCFTVLPSNGNPILYTLRNRLPFFSYIDAQGKVTLMCWGFATFGVKFGVDQIRGFENFEEALKVLHNQLIENLKAGQTLGIESSCPKFVLDTIGGAVQPISLVEVDDLLDRQRLVKSAQELELIRKSTEIIETTMAELYDHIKIGMSRLELMRLAKTMLFDKGATGISHITFSFGQANPEIAIGEVLQPNRLVTLDLGGIYKGYTSDNRRYVYTGRIPAALQERYAIMVDIIDKLGEMLIPGARYADLYAEAGELYRKNGLNPKGMFNHIGHNMGLETEEEWLTDDPDKKVLEGMVINLELYSYVGSDHIGNEETYLIGANGPTRISQLPREIRIIQ